MCIIFLHEQNNHYHSYRVYPSSTWFNAGYEYMTTDRWNNTTLQFCRSNRYGHIYTQVLWESELVICHRQCQLHAAIVVSTTVIVVVGTSSQHLRSQRMRELTCECTAHTWIDCESWGHSTLQGAQSMSCAYLACDKLSMGEWLGNNLNFLQWLIRYTTGESSTAPLPQPSPVLPLALLQCLICCQVSTDIHVLCAAATNSTNQTQTTCTRALYMIQKDKLAKLHGTGFYGNHTLPNAINTTSQGPQCITMKGPSPHKLKVYRMHLYTVIYVYSTPYYQYESEYQPHN